MDDGPRCWGFTHDAMPCTLPTSETFLAVDNSRRNVCALDAAGALHCCTTYFGISPGAGPYVNYSLAYSWLPRPTITEQSYARSRKECALL